MNAPSPMPRWLAAAWLSLFCTAGCVSHQHTIGLGGTGTGEVRQRQYYFVFGLLQVNDVDAQRMAGDLTSYSIDSRFGWMDLLLAPFLLPLTATSRTVTVRT